MQISPNDDFRVRSQLTTSSISGISINNWIGEKSASSSEAATSVTLRKLSLFSRQDYEWKRVIHHYCINITFYNPDRSIMDGPALMILFCYNRSGRIDRLADKNVKKKNTHPLHSAMQIRLGRIAPDFVYASWIVKHKYTQSAGKSSDGESIRILSIKGCEKIYRNARKTKKWFVNKQSVYSDFVFLP